MTMPTPKLPPPAAPKTVRPFEEVATPEQIKARDEANEARHAAALRALASKYAKHHNHHVAAQPTPSNNGFDADSTTGTTDWDKQDRFHIGRPNDQFVGQERGRTVAGAGRPKHGGQR